MSDPTTYDNNVGNVRTTVNTAWVTAIGFALAHLFDWKIDLNDPLIVALIPGLALVVWRISNVLSQHVPWVGYILFGVNRSPGYTAPPPGLPAVAEPPPEDDRGSISLMDVLVVLLIVAVIVWLLRVL